jgi:hypothetical protein
VRLLLGKAQTSLTFVEIEPCPFCEIAAGRSEQEIVYAGDGLVAFLCEPPATWGHTLIVPGAHKEDIWSIEPTKPPRPCSSRTGSRTRCATSSVRSA